MVLEVQATWPLKGDTRLVFRKNYAKYEFFRKPTVGRVRAHPPVAIHTLTSLSLSAQSQSHEGDEVQVSGRLRAGADTFI